MAGKSAVAVAVVVLVLVAGARAGTHHLGDCTHNLHCGPDSCCRVGFQRYSLPTCSPHGDVGSPCTSQQPSSNTLHYPNNIQVMLEEAYSGLWCPCRSGLVCSRRECREPGPATDATPSIEYNSFNSEYD